jgi:hypothetical protein
LSRTYFSKCACIQIIYLKKQVDINGNGSDVDLTHWDVSHVSDASRAFSGKNV